jgi:hypothetical protein
MFSSPWTWLTSPKQNSRTAASRRRKGRCVLRCESLEARELLATAVAVAHPSYILLPHSSVSRFAGGGPTGYSPAQITQAYGINQITFNNGTVTGDGSGTTIAIVDAFDDPTIASDLHQFDQQYNLPDPTFTKVNENGGSSLPPGDTGWAEEISLDVEWAHAIAPKAAILLVEASSATFNDLLTGVQYAASQPGVVAVSMSWGAGEFGGETSFDSTFTTPSGHGGVAFLASSGDSGAPVSYPAASLNVVSVGGTTLSLTSGGNIISESGWSGSGGGLSSMESQPSYQQGVVTQSSTQRANPDVAYDADPNTGFSEYNSYSFPTAPWEQFGGTSDAAPQWAGIIAIADQGRALAGLGSLDGPSQLLPKLYSVSASDFNDITTGTSTGSPNYSAGQGYDLVTGLGTPIANKLVADLVGSSGNNNQTVTHFSVSAPSSDVAGTSFTITVSALNASNAVVPTYAGTVQFSSNDSAAVLPGPYTFSSTDGGVATLTVTLKTAGSRTVTVTDSSASSVHGTANVTVAPAAATQLVFGQQPTNVLVGSAISPAVTVLVEDPYGNVETSDNTDQVSVALGNNPGTATLGGTLTVGVSGGVAKFSDLTVSAAGTGYTLAATAVSGGLTSATSASFNVTTSNTKVIEGFETSSTWFVVGSGTQTAYRSSAAAHDGNYGLVLRGNEWFYRTDAAVQVQAGDTLSVWVRFPSSASGRAYFGFGSSSSGTLSLVAAPNTHQLILQYNPFYAYYDNLAAVSQNYQPNHWYRLEVDWGSSGAIVGKLFDSNGTSLLSSVSTGNTGITSGGIALRAIGSNVTYFDTITDNAGVNSFLSPPGKSEGTTAPLPWLGSTHQPPAAPPFGGPPSAPSTSTSLTAFFAALGGKAPPAEAEGWYGVFGRIA